MCTLKRVLTKFLFILLVVFAGFLLSSSLALAQSTDPAPIKVKVAIYPNPPKIYRDTDGVVKGFWPDVINYIAQRENWSIEYVDGTFEQGLERVKQGEVDMMPDVGYSPERAAIYTFSDETAFINWASVYAKPGTDINSFADLRGKRIAVMESDIHFIGPLGIKRLMTAFGYEATFVTVGSYEDTFKAVVNGNADFAVVNRIFGTYIAGKYDIKLTNLIFDPVELKFILTKDGKNTKYLVETLDKDVRTLKSDENSIYYRSIINNLESSTNRVEVVPPWIEPVLIGIAAVALLAVLIALFTRRYQYTLEKNVEEKTALLLQSETKFKELADLLPQTIFETNMDGVITYVNDYATKTFKYPKEKLLSNFELQDLFSENTEVPVKNFQYFTTLDLSPLKFYGKRSDDTVFPGYLYGSIIRDGGNLQGLRGVIIDLTEQKDIQEKLNQKVTELEEMMKLTVNREETMENLKNELKVASKK